MAKLLLFLFILAVGYGLPWLIASVVAGGSSTAQLAAGVAVGCCMVMGYFIAWMEDR